LDWTRLDSIGLDWIAGCVVWIGLNWIEWDWIGLLDWKGMDWIGLVFIGLD